MNGKQVGAADFYIHPPITLINLKDFYSNSYVHKRSSIQNIHCLMPNPTDYSSLLFIFSTSYMLHFWPVGLNIGELKRTTREIQTHGQ